MMIHMMLSVVAGAASPAAVVQTRPPPMIRTPEPPTKSASAAVPATRAQANLPGLFSTDDYPLKALRNEETGTVTFSVAIDRDGRVTNCTVTESSGSASLDLTTCSIIQRRARFRPARDAQGRAVEDHSTGRIKWALPLNPPMPFVDLRMAMIFTTNAAGEVTKCRIESNAEQPPPAALCDAVIATGRKVAAELRRRLALNRRELVLEQGLRVGGPEAARSVGRGPGETLAMLTALALEVDATGKISRCIAADGNMNGQGADLGCTDSAKRTFIPLEAAASDRSDRHAVRYWATYTRPIR